MPKKTAIEKKPPQIVVSQQGPERRVKVTTFDDGVRSVTIDGISATRCSHRVWQSLRPYTTAPPAVVLCWRNGETMTYHGAYG